MERETGGELQLSAWRRERRLRSMQSLLFCDAGGVSRKDCRSFQHIGADVRLGRGLLKTAMAEQTPASCIVAPITSAGYGNRPSNMKP